MIWLAKRVVEALQASAESYPTEAALQEGIARVLTKAGLSFTREERLSPRDRPDFFVTMEPGMVGVAIEVKVGGSASALLRQLSRYTEHQRVGALVVAVTRSRLKNLPETLNGKPIFAVNFAWSAL